MKLLKVNSDSRSSPSGVKSDSFEKRVGMLRARMCAPGTKCISDIIILTAAPSLELITQTF